MSAVNTRPETPYTTSHIASPRLARWTEPAAGGAKSIAPSATTASVTRPGPKPPYHALTPTMTSSSGSNDGPKCRCSGTCSNIAATPVARATP